MLSPVVPNLLEIPASLAPVRHGAVQSEVLSRALVSRLQMTKVMYATRVSVRGCLQIAIPPLTKALRPIRNG